MGWNNCLPKSVSSVFFPILFCRHGLGGIFFDLRAIDFLVDTPLILLGVGCGTGVIGGGGGSLGLVIMTRRGGI